MMGHGEQDGKPTKMPSNWGVALRKLGAGMLCLALFQVGGGYFPLQVHPIKRGKWKWARDGGGGRKGTR